MLLIPGRCLSILPAVWNSITFGFSKSLSIGVRRTRFQIQAKRQSIGAKQRGDNKIAAIVDDIGNIGEGSA
jgi:hypothetical protein